MKKLFAGLLMLAAASAQAQFTPGQLLTAAELNSQFALYAPLAGATFSGPVSASSFTGTPISGSTGSFTNLSASGTVSFPTGTIAPGSLSSQAANTVLANATGSSASPTAISVPSCSTSTSALNWTSGSGFSCGGSGFAALAGATFTGTVQAPTLVSTGNILGPGAGYSIGTVTGISSGGAIQIFDSTHGNNVSILVGGSTEGLFNTTGFNGAVGATTSNTGAFTTLSASSTVSGTGFSTYLASPPAIGGTTAAAGSFTTLSSSSNSAVFSTNTSAQSIPNGAFTTVTGWTAVTDRNSNWTISTGTFTAPRAGNYLVSAALSFASVAWPANTNLSLAVFKNGTEIAQATKIVDAAVTANQGVTLPSVLVNCATSDVLTIRVFQSQGASVALGSTAATNWVSIAQVP